MQDYLALPGARTHLEGFLTVLRRCEPPAQLCRKDLILATSIHSILM